MKYNEFIHVNEEFNPVYDLEDERDNAWKLFIPNDNFREILSSVIDSLDTSNPKNPVWLQGTYGTGKSHATSVIKHLLSDEEITNFDLEDNQLTAKLDNFRENNNIMPVVLKGTSTIGTPEKFRITLQTAVKNTLKERGIRVTVPSDFEHIITLLDEETITLQEKDTKDTILELYDLEGIKNRLKEQDATILIAIEDILEKKRLGSIQIDIVEWLTEVRNELKKEYDIDYLMIFWDEFTGALTQLNVEDILLEIQNIAEAKNNGLSLFIVSHRTRTNQIDVNEEKIEKIMDRFKKINYSMEPVATYELMEKSIDKDKQQWEEVKNRFIEKIEPLIERISADDGPNVKKALANLYPIHPYTAYLATFIAREIGSTERSIFRFLHDDDENGFKNFIDTFEINERFYLTAEYLWDFFYKDFDEKDDDRISSAIQKYKLHYNKLKQEGEEYLTIFKVILLLNILFKIAEVGKDSLAIPSRENINNIFIGSIYEDKVKTVLDYIDKQSVINETPDHYFEITTNVLNPKDVKKEELKLRKTLNLKTILNEKDLKDLKNNISKKVTREIEISIKEGNIQKNRLISELEKGLFKNPGYLHMILFLCKNEKELIEIEDVIKSVSKEGLLNNVIIAISENSFKEKNLNKFLGFKANAIVAKKFNYKEDEKVLNERANKLTDEWINNIKTGIVHWYSNKNEGKSTLGEFINTINDKISKSIFNKGLENIKNANVKTTWTKKTAKIQAKQYISSTDIYEIETNQNSKRTVAILYYHYDNNIAKKTKFENIEKIVDTNLNLKEIVPENHPIKLISEFVDEKLKNAQQKGEFNIGEELKPLSKAPYGLYSNEVNIAALAFVMRNYVNNIYDGKGNPINEKKMEELVMNMFEYWEKNKKRDKLQVRFGTEEEKELIKQLSEIFNLNINPKEKTIKNVRWGIREWIKNNKTPLWLFNYKEDLNEPNKKIIKSLRTLLRPKDEAIPDEYVQECYYNLINNTYDFDYLINKTDTNQLLRDYIYGINDAINIEDIDNIIEYLIKHLPEEIYDWEDDKVSGKVKDWIIEQQNKQKPKEEKEEVSEIEPSRVTKKPETTIKKIKEETTVKENKAREVKINVIEEIREEDPEIMIDIIIQILETDEDIRNKFAKYLRDKK